MTKPDASTDSKTWHESSTTAIEKDLFVRCDTSPVTGSVPPDGGYGWVVVACQTTINAMTWGVNASYAVYLSHFTASGSIYFPGTTTLQYTFVGGVSVGLALFVSPLATLLNNRYGYRVPMLLGCIMEATAFICASFARNFWQLFMSQGCLFGISMGFLFSPSVGMPSQWFTKRRALATGICAGGSGIGGILFNLGTDAMIANISLAWAYRITAMVVFVSNLTATLLTREYNPPRHSQRRQDCRSRRDCPEVQKSLLHHTGFRHPGFLYLLAWGVFSLLGYVTLQFSISKFAVSSLHLTQTQGSNLAALLSAGMAVGRPLVGFIADRIGRINGAILFTGSSGLLCLAFWIPLDSYPAMIVFCVLEGLVAGTFWSLVIPVTAELVGMDRLATCSSAIWLVMSVPCTFATTLALSIVGESGNYTRLIGFTGGMYFFAAILLVGAKVQKQHSLGVNAWAICIKT